MLLHRHPGFIVLLCLAAQSKGMVIFMKKVLSILITLTLLFALSSVAFAGEINYVYSPTCKLVGHRGLSIAAPENTLASFELAGQMGLDAIEFDIWPTTDGIWVVMHDEKVDRMTDKEGNITAMTFDETQQCTIDAGNGIENYPGQKIPTLEQVLDVCKKYNATPFIEIKGGTAAEFELLLNHLKTFENHREFVFISFNNNYICQVKSILPENKAYWIINSPNEKNIKFCLENGIDGIDFNYYNTSTDMIEKIVSSGLTAGAWTVDSLEDFQMLCSLHIDIVTTNSIVPKENTCKHICHSDNPFLKAIWNIISFFLNLFGEQYCSCGVRH